MDKRKISNTAIVHKYEKRIYRLIMVAVYCLCVDFFIHLLKIDTYIHGRYEIIFQFVMLLLPVVALVFLMIAFGILVKLTTNTREWKKEGREISKIIGLKRIILLKSNLAESEYPDIPGYEIHHKTSSLKEGFKLLFKPKKKVMQELIDDLVEDYKRLAVWAGNEDVILFTTTHKGMINLWKKTADPHFQIIRTGYSLDPWVGMNWFEWMKASFTTTGRIKWKLPKDWETYFFVP